MRHRPSTAPLRATLFGLPATTLPTPAPATVRAGHDARLGHPTPVAEWPLTRPVEETRPPRGRMLEMVRQTGTILLVNDDDQETDLLRYALARDGFDIAIVDTGREAVSRVHALKPALVILDANLRDVDGFSILATLRAATTVPVIVLTARATDDDVLTGFRLGADDYVTKPFNMQILVARVRAVLRHGHTGARQVVIEPATGPLHDLGGAIFDSAKNELRAPGVRLALTPTESRILEFLLAHRGRALTPERILEHARWGQESLSDVRVIRTHMYHLRAKLGRLPGAPPHIRTVSGAGYILTLPATTGANDGDQPAGEMG